MEFVVGGSILISLGALIFVLWVLVNKDVK